jgi:uncharacterized DUF497 family protein
MSSDDCRFQWDSGNLRHIAAHGVSQQEAEQAVLNDLVEIRWEVIRGEERNLSVGRTNSGRVLVLSLTVRGDAIRIVTAFPASRALCDFYFREKGTDAN